MSNEEHVDQNPEPVNAGMSQPGEPGFHFGEVEIAPGLKMVVMVIAAGGGVQTQVVIRPDLALTVARLLDEQAKRTRSGLVIASNGQGIPPDLLGKGQG